MELKQSEFIVVKDEPPVRKTFVFSPTNGVARDLEARIESGDELGKDNRR